VFREETEPIFPKFLSWAKTHIEHHPDSKK
jgi:hypothetical protein